MINAPLQITNKKIYVYCDTGGWVPFLKKYKKIIEFITFPVEQSNKNVNEKIAPPSVENWEGFNDWKNENINKLSNCPYPFNQLGVSDKFKETKQIVGNSNKQDILHLDSAYKGNCKYFLTSDSDIFKNRAKLEKLLLLKIYNPHKDAEIIKDEFDSILKKYESSIV